MQTLVFPIVWVERRGPGKWRGTLQPTNRDVWWRSYETFVLHYAQIAEVANASWFSVGSELGTTETWKDRWYHLISQVERTTSARLLYSANWDHYSQVSFFARLDAIGINGYFPLSKRRDASTAEMLATWKRARETLIGVSKAAKRPLVLTEVGYPSRDGGAVKPWDYGSSAGVDLEEQRRAYSAFAQTWAGDQELIGAVFWDWSGRGGRNDRGYSPRKKPAEKVASEFFRKRASP